MDQLLNYTIKTNRPIKESSTAQFTKDVIEASREKLVLVDFWAPWCGPCRSLTPVLEKVVESYEGKVHLIKINIDQNQMLAKQLNIQSIPLVYVFFGGRPVDAFTGVIPEKEIRSFISKILVKVFPNQALDLAVQQASLAFQNKDFELAEKLYEHIVAHNPKHRAGLSGYARTLVERDNLSKAKEIIAQLEKEENAKEEVESLNLFIKLIEEGRNFEKDFEKLEKNIQKNENDWQSYYQLSLVYFFKHHYENAISLLLEIIQKNKSWEEEKARKTLISFFNAIGQTNPSTVEGRKKLSTLLFK